MLERLFRSWAVFGRCSRWIGGAALVAALAGCATPASLVLGAAGIATDTSVAWSIAKHVHEKLTEGDPVPCYRLDTVQRALSARCGSFVPGSIDARDVTTSRMQVCPLIVATQDLRHWPVLPELLSKGAQPEQCLQSPLERLAQQSDCPNFAAASPQVVAALTWLADADARAVRHDVVRMLSCPSARQVGLHRVLDRWLAVGVLHPDTAGFGVLGALHPDYLASALARTLETSGHTARASLGGFNGVQPAGFEAALRSGNFAALSWWLQRVPSLANNVPPTQADQIGWVPLARVLVPSFMPDPRLQADTVRFLMAHGARPDRRLPHDDRTTVLAHARKLKSPLVALLEAPPPVKARAGTVMAGGEASPETDGSANAIRAVPVLWGY